LYGEGVTDMLCPYCHTGFVKESETARESTSPGRAYGDDGFTVRIIFCPQCKRLIIVLEEGVYRAFCDGDFVKDEHLWEVNKESIIYPPTSMRYQIAEEVPAQYHKDFKEADMLLNISPNASAALSRRCLQSILHHELKIKKYNLDQEIKEYLDTVSPPVQIAELIDAIRQIGNMSAHAWENQVTGEIIDVEPAEADLLLSVLFLMFDYHFVQPQRARKIIEQTNVKLEAAGRKPIQMK